MSWTEYGFDEDLALAEIRISGTDARTFVQGQVTNDILAMTTSGAESLLLEPNSNVIALLWLQLIGEEDLSMVTYAQCADAVAARLKRFHLRVNCEIQEPTMVEKSTVSYGGLLGSSTPGPDELSKGLSPHAYGQTFVDAHISFSKGCFTGQELVGRLDARGANVPFVVARYEGSDPEYADAQLKKCGPEGPQGLTSVSHSEGRWRGLAIAHRTFVSSGGFEITPLS